MLWTKTEDIDICVNKHKPTSIKKKSVFSSIFSATKRRSKKHKHQEDKFHWKNQVLKIKTSNFPYEI